MTTPDSPETPETLAGYIRSGMDRLGIGSNREVERRTGLARESVNRILNGKKTGLTDESLQKLADGLGLSITRLRELSGRPVGEPSPFTVPKEFDQLTARQRRVLIDVGYALLEASEKNVSPPH